MIFPAKEEKLLHLPDQYASVMQRFNVVHTRVILVKSKTLRGHSVVPQSTEEQLVGFSHQGPSSRDLDVA